MFCPKCSAYLSENQLVKRNIKYAMGNVAVEYDVRCPHCTEEIGHMSWGQFTPLPEIAEIHYAESEATEPLIPPPPELRSVLINRRGAPAEEPLEQEIPSAETVRVCPHCGQPWPEEEA